MNGDTSQARDERTQRTRDLVWRMRATLDESLVRTGAVVSFLDALKERRLALQRRVRATEREPVLEEALVELDSSSEEIRVVGEEMDRRGNQLIEWGHEADAKLRFHRRLIERAPMGFFLTDEHGIIAEANDEAARLLQVPPSYLRSKPIVNFVSRRDVGKTRSFVRRAGQSDEIIETILVFRPRHGGALRTTEVRICSLQRSRDRALGWLVRELPATLVETGSEPPESGGSTATTVPPSVSFEREALATASHELRGPIQMVLTAVSLLKAAIPSGVSRARIDAHCDAIARASAAMTRMVSDLEDAGKLDAGMFRIERKPCDLRGVVEELLVAHQPRADKRGVSLAATLPHEAVIVDGDHVRLTQVVTNFLGNALKFTEPNKTVRVVLDVHDERARVDVIDEGHGIAPSDVPHVFERRWQAQLSSNLGSGLGLWLARGIAEAHGGTVGVLSELGTGSHFWVEVPLRHE